MRVAILSDVHANLEALQAVLEDAACHQATHYLSLGDVIGFNGDPAACVDRLIPLLSQAVRGNHEEALLHRGLFRVPLYTAMMDRTAAMLSAGQVKHLRLWPLLACWQGLTLVHASPSAPGAWPRVSVQADARAAFASFTGQVCLFGHTHRAGIFREWEGQVLGTPAVYQQEGENGSCLLPLEASCRYLINPGSVGQPRDSDWRAAYALYDDEAQTVELRRIAYDAAAAAAKISRTGLPARFGEALLKGVSPTGD